jgi:hypothetical protein
MKSLIQSSEINLLLFVVAGEEVHFLALSTKNIVFYTGEKKQFGHATFTSVIMTLASSSGHKLHNCNLSHDPNYTFSP